jgi:outer membrane protein assembly factor BamE (lipoprotein component of BamABCDE complex)
VKLLSFSLLFCISFLFVGCPSTETSTPNKHTAASTGSARKAAEQEPTEPSKIRPHRGMTKAQVRKIYGDPDNQQVTSRGETWFYFFNAGHYFIPYYFGKPRTATFHFNEAGILTDFEYNQED